jgi:hypothetical protein
MGLNENRCFTRTHQFRQLRTTRQKDSRQLCATCGLMHRSKLRSRVAGYIRSPCRRGPTAPAALRWRGPCQAITPLVLPLQGQASTLAETHVTSYAATVHGLYASLHCIAVVTFADTPRSARFCWRDPLSSLDYNNSITRRDSSRKCNSHTQCNQRNFDNLFMLFLRSYQSDCVQTALLL